MDKMHDYIGDLLPFVTNKAPTPRDDSDSPLTDVPGHLILMLNILSSLFPLAAACSGTPTPRRNNHVQK